MAVYGSLAEAMAAGDELAEAEIRFRLLAEVFEAEPKLRGNLNTALERAKAEIVRLRAAQASKPVGDSVVGQVVRFDPGRFQKSSG
ncbi:hypothetical protein FIV07_10340 [Mycobacterium sp. THAF192]|nr:hypothetical protein FIV07_10340 [Mycobacterium sp. THAF192]